MFFSVFGVYYGLFFCALSCYMAVQIAKDLQTTTYINQLKEAKHNPPWLGIWFPPPLCNVVPPKLLCYSWALCGGYCSWWLLRRFFIAAAGAAAVLTLCNTKMHAQIFNDIDMYALYIDQNIIIHDLELFHICWICVCCLYIWNSRQNLVAIWFAIKYCLSLSWRTSPSL